MHCLVASLPSANAAVSIEQVGVWESFAPKMASMVKGHGKFIYRLYGNVLFESSIRRLTDTELSGRIWTTLLLCDRGNVLDFTIADGRLYVATDQQGIRIFDLAYEKKWDDLERVRWPLVEEIPFPKPGSEQEGLACYKVHIDGDHLYASVEKLGLVVYQIGQNGSLVERGVCEEVDRITDMVTVDELLYAANGGLVVVDVENPADPEVVFENESGGIRLAHSEHRLYMSSPEEGLQIFDLNQPRSPRKVSNTVPCEICGPSSDWNTDIVVRDEKLFAVTHKGGLRIVDVHTPESPSLLYENNPGNVSEDLHQVGSVYVDDELIHTFRGIRGIYAWFESGELMHLGHDSQFWHHFVDVIVRDGIAYVLEQASVVTGVGIFDVSDPSHPRRLGRYHTSPGSEVIDLDGDHFFLGKGRHGIEIIDISDPEQPWRVTTFQPLFQSNDDTADKWYKYISAFKVDGDRAYVGYRDHFQIVDVSDRANPQLLGEVSEPHIGSSVRILVRDGLVYLAYWAGFCIVDARDPQSPKILSHMRDFSMTYMDFELFGDYALVAAEQFGMHIIDISDPTDPRVIWGDRSRELGGTLVLDDLTGHKSMFGSVRSIEMDGRFAYFTRYPGVVTVVDTKDPFNPTFEARYSHEYGYYTTYDKFDFYDGHCFVPLEPVWEEGLTPHFHLSILRIDRPLWLNRTVQTDDHFRFEWQGGKPPYTISVYDHLDEDPRRTQSTGETHFSLPFSDSQGFISIESSP